MFIRRIVGSSMTPTMREGQIVVAKKIKNLRIGNVVIANADGREVVKRIKKLSPNITLVGDNKNSAKYHDVSESDILGVVIWPIVKT